MKQLLKIIAVFAIAGMVAAGLYLTRPWRPAPGCTDTHTGIAWHSAFDCERSYGCDPANLKCTP